jgi:hypothetical protein
VIITMASNLSPDVIKPSHFISRFRCEEYALQARYSTANPNHQSSVSELYIHPFTHSTIQAGFVFPMFADMAAMSPTRSHNAFPSQTGVFCLPYVLPCNPANATVIA